MEGEIVTVVWGKERLSISVPTGSTMAQLKSAIHIFVSPFSCLTEPCRTILAEASGVAPNDQRIMGLRGGKNDSDAAKMGKKIQLIGTKAEEVVLIKSEMEQFEREEQKRQLKAAERAAKLEQQRIARQVQDELDRTRYLEEQRIRQEEAQERRQLQMAQVHERELAEEMQEGSSLEFSMAVNSVAFAVKNSKNSNIGDKVSFPESLLQRLIDAHVSLPCNFRIQNPTNGKVVYVGVADFGASRDEERCFAPHWILAALEMEEGDTVDFTTVQLPSGTAVVLRPHTNSWRPLNQSDAGESLLAEQFSANYTSLSAGQTIEIESQRALWKFDVVEIEPSDAGAISLLQTDLALDFLPALDSSESSNELPRLEMGEEITAEGSLLHFSFRLKSDDCILLSCKPMDGAGDVDLFISSNTRNPGPNDFEMACVNDIGAKEIAMEGNKGNEREYVVACVANGESVRYTLRVEFNLKPPVEGVDGGTVCDNCRRSIPEAALQMHQLRCPQLVYRCAVCDETMSAKSKDKHQSVMHELIECLHCGENGLERRVMPLHLREECEMRLSRCLYCAAPIVHLEQGAHQNLCGKKQAKCLHCEHSGLRHEMREHARRTHHVWDPKAGSDWVID